MIFGCGPAGLFAAQAIKVYTGTMPAIVSQKKMSFIYGAQYLHKPIPGLCDRHPDTVVRTILRGTPNRYAERVYEDGHRLTSWSKAQPRTPAWDLRKTYERAWERFESIIVDMPVGPSDIMDWSSRFDVVISTIPLWSICHRQWHFFLSKKVLVRQHFENSELATSIDRTRIDAHGYLDGYPDWVVYNGTEGGDWYRASSIFGHRSIEAPMRQHLAEQGGWEAGIKIIGNNCDCNPNVIRAGRMGRWETGVLTHNAYESSLEAIAEQSPSIGG